MTPHIALTVIRPDEVAECWEGVDDELCRELWSLVPFYKNKKTPEEMEEPCIGLDCVADFWHHLSEETQTKLNNLAERIND